MVEFNAYPVTMSSEVAFSGGSPKIPPTTGKPYNNNERNVIQAVQDHHYTLKRLAIQGRWVVITKTLLLSFSHFQSVASDLHCNIQSCNSCIAAENPILGAQQQ